MNLTKEQLEELLFILVYNTLQGTAEMLHKGKKATARKTYEIIAQGAQKADSKAIRALMKKGKE